MSEIEKIIREEIGKITEKDGFKIPSNANLINEIGLDSLNVLEMFDLIEEKFNILIAPEKFFKIKTIEDIVKIIENTKKNN